MVPIIPCKLSNYKETAPKTLQNRSQLRLVCADEMRALQ
jgi:hypothetical protein